MFIPSHSQSKSLSINVFQPVPVGKMYITTISDTSNAWRHTTKAEGGYWDGGFSIRGNKSLMEDWLQDGLFRHIEVLGASGDKVWEGFVNKVTITYGGVSVTRGPFLEIINNVMVVYTKQSETDSGMSSATKYTNWNYSQDSVRKYGMRLQRALNAGIITDDEAIRIRDMYLNEHKWPEAKQDISTSRHESNIIVECVGYCQLLDRVVCQTWTPNAGAEQEKTLTMVSASAKIKMALSMNADNIFSYTEKLGNPRFETAGAGGVDVFGSWSETASDGAIARVSLTNQPTINYCARITAGASYNTKISQSPSVIAGKSYALCFSTQGDSFQGRYKVFSGGTNVIPVANTRVPSGYDPARRYTRVGNCFTVPAGITSLTLELYCPYKENKSVWFDDVTFADWTEVEENSIEVAVKQTGYKSSWSVIKHVLSQSDSSDNRWLFGIYNDRIPKYHVAPSSYEYIIRTMDNKLSFFKLNGEEVPPYLVLPGKWALFTDLLVGTATPSNIKEDPRAMFIEEARYSAEEGLTLNSGRLSQLSQRLGRLGITGISA